MTDGEALYQAIVSRPEDDTPRLVYADWLEENGHVEEAEFIRLECQLEAATPDRLCGDPELSERREELRLWLRAHAPREAKKLRGLSLDLGRDWWTTTQRGFPCYLTIQHKNRRLGSKGVRRIARALEKAFANFPMRFLIADFPHVADLAELLKQPVIAALERISIKTNEQSGEEAASLIADCRLLGNLKGAALSFPLTEAGAAALGRSQHLNRIEWLVLDTFQLTPAVIRQLGSWLQRVRDLHMSDGLAPEVFEELCRQSCPRLHTLDLSGNNFPASSWLEFARSKAFPQLKELWLNETDMSHGQMAALTAADLHLTALALGSCAIGNEGARALCAAPWIDRLQHLDLSRNLLGTSGTTALAACARLGNLKYLNLSGNPIRGTGLNSIAESTSLRKLTTLRLEGCRDRGGHLLSDHFQRFLQKLDMPRLRQLDLSNMPIGYRAAQLLAAEKFRNFTRLHLSNCQLTDISAADLLTSPSFQDLIELDLSGNHLKTGVQVLANRHVLPRLSCCQLQGNPLAAELRRRLSRRPGFVVPSISRE